MIQMSMGYDHRIDIARRNGQRIPVAQAQRLISLKETAIDEDAVAPMLQKIFGARHRSGATQEGKRKCHKFIP